MNVQTIALPGVGAQALTTGGSGHQLNEATAAGAGRFVFRRTFGLRITTGGMADGIRFDVGAADLAATFAPLEIDMLDEPPTSVQQKDGQTLTVTLPVPMQLRRVTFSGSKKKAKKSKVPTGTVELYRLDGDALAKEFTTSAKDNSTIADEFIDGRFGIKLKGSAGYHDITPDVLHDVMAKGFPTSARLGLAELPASGQPLAPNFFAVIPGEVGRTPDVSGTAADAAAGLATALQQYFDGLTPPYPQTVDVLLVAESDAPCKLTTSTFAIPFGLVRTSFRAVLLRPADLADADSFAVRLSEASTPLTSYLRGLLTVETQQNLDRSSGGAVPPPVLAAIVQQLNSALQTEAFYTAPRFAGIDLKPETVAAAAAAPAGLARTRINRTLLEEAFASELVPLGKTGADEKEVLRATETNGAIDVSVDVPRTIAISKATLRLEGDVRGGAPAALLTNGGGSEQTAGWDAPIANSIGFMIDAAHAVATQLTPAAALNATGIAAAVSALTTSVELIAELRADEQGSPGGRTLAAGTIKLEQLDRPQWLLFSFASGVVLTEAACWIVLRATDGSAVWLAEQTSSPSRVGDPAAKGWTDRDQFTDRRPLCQILSDTQPAGDDVDEGVRVAIGNVVLTPAAANGGKARTVDLTTALQTFLAAQPAMQPVVVAPIRVSALGRGNLTIYPPEIEYDVLT